MFYYFGGKTIMARRYDAPQFPTIVEPFAGSASYSMYHARQASRIVLIEKDERVIELWERLLRMTPEQVLAIRVPEAGERIRDFLYMTAATSNAIANTSHMKTTDRQPRAIRVMLHRIARTLPLVQGKIKVRQGDYRDAPDIEATWFIDPPYQVTGQASKTTRFPQGMGYAPGCKSSDLDYGELAEWCRSRQGQIVVCEQEGADWLPFWPLPLADAKGTRTRQGSRGQRTTSKAKRLSEMVWANHQQPLFAHELDAEASQTP